jgi:hypothetical protein
VSDISTTAVDLSECILGETTGPLPLHDQSAVRAAGIRMAAKARRELLIFSHDLDAALYDQQPFLDAVRRVALQAADLPVRILVYEAEPAVRNGHRLIELARHLSSRIGIRRVPAESQQAQESYLLADGRGYVLRRLAGQQEATADFHAPLEVRRLREQFEGIWEVAEPDPELRRLYL